VRRHRRAALRSGWAMKSLPLSAKTVRRRRTRRPYFCVSAFSETVSKRTDPLGQLKPRGGEMFKGQSFSMLTLTTVATQVCCGRSGGDNWQERRWRRWSRCASVTPSTSAVAASRF
jgi:hypothetical protein